MELHNPATAPGEVVAVIVQSVLRVCSAKALSALFGFVEILWINVIGICASTTASVISPPTCGDRRFLLLSSRPSEARAGTHRSQHDRGEMGPDSRAEPVIGPRFARTPPRWAGMTIEETMLL